MSNKQITSNPDVPDRAVIKQLLIENGKLKSEIQYLENELANKNKAIKAFKKWQRDVTQRNIYEWLREARNLQEPLFSVDTANALRELIPLTGNLKQIKHNMKTVLKVMEKLNNNIEIQRLLNDTEEE